MNFPRRLQFQCEKIPMICSNVAPVLANTVIIPMTTARFDGSFELVSNIIAILLRVTYPGLVEKKLRRNSLRRVFEWNDISQ